MFILSHQLLPQILLSSHMLGQGAGLLSLVVVHLLKIFHIPELDLVVVAGAGDYFSRAAHVHPLDGHLLLMVPHHPQEPVRIQVDSSDVAVLAASDDHVVCDADHGVDTVRVPGELVTVQTILVFTARENMIS